MFSNPDIRNWASVVLGSIIACGAALADAFYFKAFGPNADLIIFMGGLGALGLHTTAVTALNSTPSSRSTTEIMPRQ